MKNLLRCIGTILLCAALYGCGDGTNNGVVVRSSITDRYVFPAGKATITFSAISTAQLPASISGIDFTLNLPAGMDVTTTTGGSGQIDSSTVIPGAALTGTNLAFGSYSASTRKAILGMATTSDNFRAGEFLRLDCNVARHSSISLGDLKAINNPVLLIKAVGYDPATTSTVQFTSKVRVNIGAAR